MSQLVIAREIKIALFFVPVIEGERIRIERAPDDFRLFSVRRQIWEIDVVKKSRLDWPREQILKNRFYPFRSALPVERDSRFPIMRDRDPRPAVQHRFAHRRDRSGIMDV